MKAAASSGPPRPSRSAPDGAPRELLRFRPSPALLKSVPNPARAWIMAQLLGGKIQLSGRVFLRIGTPFNIWRFDRNGPTTHVRVRSAGRESRGTGLMFFA